MDSPKKPPSETASENQGGQGEALLTDPGHLRQDCILIEKHADGFTQAKLEAVATKLLMQLVHATRTRDLCSIARAYATLDRLNLEHRKEKREVAKESVSDEDAKEKAARVIEQIRAMQETMRPNGSSNTRQDPDEQVETVRDIPPGATAAD